MKKLFLFLAMVMVAMMSTVQAQTVQADFSSLDKLIEKLGKAVAKTPAKTNEADIDAYVQGCNAAAIGAVASAEQLHSLYARQIGETVDGVQDVTVTKPTKEDWQTLAATLATQTAGTAELAVAGQKAAEAVKKADKMKAIKLGKPVKWSADIMPVIVEALAEETKAVNQIIQLLQSEKNL